MKKCVNVFFFKGAYALRNMIIKFSFISKNKHISEEEGDGEGFILG